MKQLTINNYKVITINNYKVSIFYSYNGTQLFISDANGVQIYAHKVTGSPIEKAVEIIEAL